MLTSHSFMVPLLLIKNTEMQELRVVSIVITFWQFVVKNWWTSLKIERETDLLISQIRFFICDKWESSDRRENKLLSVVFYHSGGKSLWIQHPSYQRSTESFRRKLIYIRDLSLPYIHITGGRFALWFYRLITSYALNCNTVIRTTFHKNEQQQNAKNNAEFQTI